MRDDFIINSVRISELESELNNIIEQELRARVNNMKLFENLTTEKPTGLFLNLAKKNPGGSGIGKIKKDDGTAFVDELSRNEHIVSFYEDLYKKDPVEPENFDGIVETFLGEEILNSDIVRNSKLSEVETQNMEHPISLDELDKSLKDGNSKSAPGIDGFGMPLVKKIWSFLRHPLQKYANHCFETGTLTENFKGASIRLIPKKMM